MAVVWVFKVADSTNFSGQALLEVADSSTVDSTILTVAFSPITVLFGLMRFSSDSDSPSDLGSPIPILTILTIHITLIILTPTIRIRGGQPLTQLAAQGITVLTSSGAVLALMMGFQE